jgi:hypothetical protein
MSRGVDELAGGGHENESVRKAIDIPDALERGSSFVTRANSYHYGL